MQNTQGTECRIQDAGYRMQNTQGTGCRIKDTEVQYTGYRMQG